MVDLDVLGGALRIVAYAIACPGLIAWAMVAYRRKQRGISALMTSTSLFLLCLMVASYARGVKQTHDASLLISTIFAVAIAFIVIVSLRAEFRRSDIKHRKVIDNFDNSSLSRTAE